MPEQPSGATEPDTGIAEHPLPARRTAAPEPEPEAAPAPEAAPEPAPEPEPAAAVPESETPPDGEPGPDPDSAPPRPSTPSLLVLAVAAVVLVAATTWHLGTVFLSIAPSNTASQSYQAQINAHVFPEFEQNWQLFAPNPLQDNIAVEVQLQTLSPEGAQAQSGWIGLTAQDVAHIRGNPLPSHLDQNLLRRAWDYYTAWHSQQDESSVGSGGPLSKEYLKRIALQRFGRDWRGHPISQLRFRAATTPVAGPTWTGAQQNPKTSYRTLTWWVVGDDDYAGLL